MRIKNSSHGAHGATSGCFTKARRNAKESNKMTMKKTIVLALGGMDAAVTNPKSRQ